MDENDHGTSSCSICGRELPAGDGRCPWCDPVYAPADEPGPTPRLLRIREPGAVRPLQVVLICLVIATVGGGMLLLSAAQPVGVVDGAIPWSEQSPLRAVVQLLCLNYQMATPYAGDVKNYLLGLGAGLAIFALGIAVAARARSSDEECPEGDESVTLLASTDSRAVPFAGKRHIAPLLAAQVLIGLYLLWSFASSRWSQASELAFGASVLLTIYFLWAFALGNGLGAAGAVRAGRVIIAVTTITAIVAIWYHYGRKPTMRVDFPVGNPTFLAACLIPGLLLCIGLVAEQVSRPDQRTSRRAVVTVAGLLAFGAMAWAFYLADSRGPLLGLLFALIAVAFFALRGRWRWLPVLAAVAVVAAGWFYYQYAVDGSLPGGRSTSLRLRIYAWDYAWSMFNEHPFKGHGQSGFVLNGDAHAIAHVLDDPLVFESRIAHAHNEWLEIMADLGAIGLVLVVAALAITLRAGMLACASDTDPRRRWTLIALLASLVGLCVDACFGVGLRVSGVPTMFYTVLGLCWAMSGDGNAGLLRHIGATRSGRTAGLIVGGTLGIIALVVTQQDFSSARYGQRAEAAMAGENFDEAIRLLTLGTNRLNPQRALTNLFLLSKAHLRAAQSLQRRAMERERRAHETEPPNPRILMFAHEDYRLSDEHCEQGIKALKELVKCSPDFLNHGQLEYDLNFTKVQNAATRDKPDEVDALLGNAMRAAERELRRQPFDPSIAADFVRVAAPRVPTEHFIAVLARPLRHHRLDTSYVDILSALDRDPVFRPRFEAILSQARRTAGAMRAATSPTEADTTWSPELLRLGAALAFLDRNYPRARDLLTIAEQTYEAFATVAPMGAASCSAELADARFFASPSAPGPAIESAAKAISLAPRSFPGRQLQQSVQARLVDYYLAAANEDYARTFLVELAPPEASNGDVGLELAARYGRLCESIMSGYGLTDLAKEENTTIVTLMNRWATRAAELDPKAPMPHVLQANLSLAAGQYEACAAEIQRAITLGMPAEEGVHFLDFALQQAPDNEPLKTLRESLAPSTQQTAGPEQPQSRPKTDPAGRVTAPESTDKPSP